MIRPIQWHLQMPPECILVKRHSIRLCSAPRVIPNFMITQCCVYLKSVILKSLNPSGIIFIRPFVNFFLLCAPMPHNQVTRHHHKGRVFFFHGIHNEPKGIFPSLLWILNIEIKKIGDTDEGPRFFALGEYTESNNKPK